MTATRREVRNQSLSVDIVERVCDVELEREKNDSQSLKLCAEQFFFESMF